MPSAKESVIQSENVLPKNMYEESLWDPESCSKFVATEFRVNRIKPLLYISARTAIFVRDNRGFVLSEYCTVY